ncbi:MAG TPA: TraR/DksA family transcriptional regulator, partial [Sporichthya sp.]|nr:TraR/DksA family transcriptional regulator [Sporichthya sp.]
PAEAAPAAKSPAAAPAAPVPAQAQPVEAAAKPSGGRLPVREGETAWTPKELQAVRAELGKDVDRLRDEIAVARSERESLLRDYGDGSGEDQADAGTKTLEREQEMSLVNNALDMLQQDERALSRLDDGSYGQCESCGNPIGKARLQAFPRATLCVSCKQRAERR